MSAWKKDKNSIGCPSCGNQEAVLYTWNNSISKPRPEYHCEKCQYEWHYSRQGNAVSNLL